MRQLTQYSLLALALVASGGDGGTGPSTVNLTRAPRRQRIGDGVPCRRPTSPSGKRTVLPPRTQACAQRAVIGQWEMRSC